MSKLNRTLYLVVFTLFIFASYYNFIYQSKYFNVSISLAITSGLVFGTSWLIPKTATNKQDKRLRLLYVILFFTSLFLGYEMINHEIFKSLTLPNTIYSWISALFFGLSLSRITNDAIILEYPIISAGLTIIVVLINYFVPFYITIPVSIVLYLLSLIMVKRNVKS